MTGRIFSFILINTRLFLILIALQLPWIVSGCARPSSGSITPVSGGHPAPVAARLLKGVSLSPRSFGAADFTDFFEKARLTGQVISWAGDWNEVGMNNGGPKVVAELAPGYNLIPVIEVQFFDQASGKLLRPLDRTTLESYRSSIAAFAEKYRPAYLSIGIEVNILYEESPLDFDAFVTFFDEVHRDVKVNSPGTKVFTIFQLERMKGLNGGLFGGKNNPDKSEWALLERFPDSDVIAFTTYPCLVYRNPADIPLDYYSEIKNHTDKPVIFTETGWHSAGSPAGWESSEAEQAEFVNRFFELSADLNKEMVIWSFMFDPKAIGPFNSMGLVRRDGTVRPAWDAWIRDR